MCRASHGARGLKPEHRGLLQGAGGRAPHGARGLKLSFVSGGRHQGAWIETRQCRKGMDREGRAPYGARGLKLLYHPEIDAYTRSRPTRGAWVETSSTKATQRFYEVAPHTGRVD